MWSIYLLEEYKALNNILFIITIWTISLIKSRCIKNIFSVTVMKINAVAQTQTNLSILQFKERKYKSWMKKKKCLRVDLPEKAFTKQRFNLD